MSGRMMYYYGWAIAMLLPLMGCGGPSLPDPQSLPAENVALAEPHLSSTTKSVSTADGSTTASTPVDPNSLGSTTGGGTTGTPASTTGSPAATGGGTGSTTGTPATTTGGGTSSTTGTPATTTGDSNPTTTGSSTGGGSTGTTGTPSTSPGSTTGGPGTASYNAALTTAMYGTVANTTLALSTAVYGEGTDASGYPTLVVTLSDRADLCSLLTQKKTAPNAHQLRIVFSTGSAAPPSDASYAFAATNGATGTFTFYDSLGWSTLSSSKSQLHTGQATLSDYGRGPTGDAQGSFQGLVGSQNDGISGTFNATYCAGGA